MNQEEKEKIKIKLERHKWPDEIAAEKKKRKKIGVNIISIVLIFAIGWTFGSVFYQSPGTVQDVNVARFARVYEMLKSNWFFINDMDNPDTQLIENAIKGMIDRNGDSHTSYMTEEESQQFTASIDLSFVGIGVTYQPADRLITRVFKNSPAEKAGIQAGDIMISVDDIMLSTLEEGADLKEYILGEKGTIVKIGVERNAEIKNFDVTRDNINALTWGEMLDDETAYLEISSFGTSLAESVELYLNSFKEEGAKNLILDFRDNGGGYLEAINSLSELFFEEGTTIYFEKFTNGEETEYKLKNSRSHLYPYDDIVVLINENSASASEVFALALRDNIGATLVGNTTYGKGTVQRQTQDGIDKSYLKYTFAKWYSPSKVNIHEVGVEPDVKSLLPDIFYEPYIEIEKEITSYDTVDDAVKYIQKGLNFLGYHNGREDSYYDLATRDSIHKYKADKGLTLNDTIDQEFILSVYSNVVKEWALNKNAKDTQLKKALEVIQLGT